MEMTDEELRAVQPWKLSKKPRVIKLNYAGLEARITHEDRFYHMTQTCLGFDFSERLAGLDEMTMDEARELCIKKHEENEKAAVKRRFPKGTLNEEHAKLIRMSYGEVPTRHYTYLISCGPYWTKVGISKNAEQRLQGLQGSNPYKLELRHTWSFSDQYGASTFEGCCHRHLMHLAEQRGEWFRLNHKAAKRHCKEVLTAATIIPKRWDQAA